MPLKTAGKQQRTVEAVAYSMITVLHQMQHSALSDFLSTRRMMRNGTEQDLHEWAVFGLPCQ